MRGLRHGFRWFWFVCLVTAAAVAVAPMPVARAFPGVETERRGVGTFSAVAVAPDGGAVVTGFVHWDNLLVRRYGPGGALLWARRWQLDVSRPHGLDVAVGPDGSIYVVGGAECGRLEGGGFVVRKYGPDGGLRWLRKSPGGFCAGADTATGVAVRGGLVVVVGHRYGCCATAADDGWIRAYRPDGRLRWVRDFEVPGISGTTDAALGVAIGGLGRIYVVGNVATAPWHDTSELVDHEAALQKLAPGGAVIWTRVVRDAGVTDWDRFSAVAVRGDRVMVTGVLDGWTYRGAGLRGWLGRFDFGGGLEWSRTWGATWRQPEPAGVSVSPSGVTVVADTTSYRFRGDDIGLRAYGPSGTLRWSRFLRGPERDLSATDVAVASEGFFLSGHAEPSPLGARLWRWSAAV